MSILDIPQVKAAYDDGINAVYHAGKYRGTKETPPNPYPAGTPEHDAWDKGVNNAEHDLKADDYNKG